MQRLIKELTQLSAHLKPFFFFFEGDSRIVLPSTFWKSDEAIKKSAIDSKEEITLCLTQAWTLAWASWIKFCTAAVAIDDIDQNQGYHGCAWGHQLDLWKCASCAQKRRAGFFFFHLCERLFIFFPTWQSCDIRGKRLINCTLASCWQIHREFRGTQDSTPVECCYLSSNGWQLHFTSALNIRPISRPAVTEVKIRKKIKGEANTETKSEKSPSSVDKKRLQRGP